MVNYYYSLEYANLWMGIKETAFRTNAQGLDTANLNNSSFRRFPIKWEGAISPQPLKYIIERKRSAGKGLDYSNHYRNGQHPIKFTITGEVLDFAFLYQLCGACTTAGSYTHTFITSTAQTNPPPSFQILQKIANVTSANDKYVLYVGCIVTDFICTWNEGTARLMGTLTIECAKSIVGLALAADPTWITDPPYYFNPVTGFDFKVATVAQEGYCASWTFHWNNGRSLRYPSYLVTPDMIVCNFRTIELDFKWVTKTTTDFDASQGDPTTDQDIDIIHTLSGGDGSDGLVWTWAKAALELLGEDYDYKDFYLARKYKVTLNPALASTLNTVESNGADSTYY